MIWHILGIICGYLAGAILVGAGAMGTPTNGSLITWGVAVLVGATVAVIDGARAFPQIGMWKIGAKFSGLSDVGVIIITAVMIVALVITFAL